MVFLIRTRAASVPKTKSDERSLTISISYAAAVIAFAAGGALKAAKTTPKRVTLAFLRSWGSSSDGDGHPKGPATERRCRKCLLTKESTSGTA